MLDQGYKLSFDPFELESAGAKNEEPESAGAKNKEPESAGAKKEELDKWFSNMQQGKVSQDDINIFSKDCVVIK